MVVGHSGAAGWVYFFHMPLFFILSGVCAKPPADGAGFRDRLALRARRLLIPYLAFLLLFTAIRYAVPPQMAAEWYRHDLLTVLLGGAALVGDYAPFWFITCLFATQTLFDALHAFIRRPLAILPLIAAAYGLAHWEALDPRLAAFACPWSVDTALLALAYYSIGYYLRPLFAGEWRPAVAVPLGVAGAAAALLLPMYGIVPFWLDMKTRHYTNPALDLCIPCVLSLALCYAAGWLARRPGGPLLARLGAASLTVMYLHMIVNACAANLPVLRGALPFTLIGLVVPWWVCHPVLSRFGWTRRILLGQG